LNLHTPCGVSLASDEVRYRSAHPTGYRTSKSRHQLSPRESRASAAFNAGGDDPIRTDGAFRRRSALAVRCLRPLGHVSLKSLVGMERFELSRAKALVSRTSVSSISTTSPQLTNFKLPEYTPSDRVGKYKPVDRWWAPRDSNPEDDTALEAAASTNSARSPQKCEAPRFIEGLRRIRRLNLNQPHPSMPRESLRLSDRYDWNRFFTKTSIPHFQILCNQLYGNYPK
jgi:hypothetical protein